MARLNGNSGKVAGLGLAVAGAAALLFLLTSSRGGAVPNERDNRALIGEARSGAVTVPLAAAVPEVAVSGAKAAGRPIVLLDPGHGGDDPGAVAVSTTITEKELTLTLARELRDELVERGRVRVAMTRDKDTFLSLDQRAAIARQLGASLFLSLHMDSAPNPLARGASVYSLSDVASDADAARFAAAENARGANPGSEDGSVHAMLSDLGARMQMNESAELASRLVRKAAGRVELRPEPHRFASFHVLRRSEAPAVLFEAGYISNADDELLLRSPEYRARIVSALAQAVEADVAARSRR
jgi:N-acetylmuramoyl-L-alanine amidase